MIDTRNKTPKQDQLRRLEDRMIQEILAASPDELRDDLRAEGEDPDAMIALARQKLVDAKSEIARARLDAAKKQADAFRASEGKVLSLENARKKLASAQAGAAADLMMAARKGKGLSENDEAALLEAMAELEKLGDDEGVDE